MTTVRTIGLTGDLAELGCREEVFDSSLCGRRDLVGDVKQGDRFSTEAFDCQSMCSCAGFVRNSLAQAFKVHRHAAIAKP